MVKRNRTNGNNIKSVTMLLICMACLCVIGDAFSELAPREKTALREANVQLIGEFLIQSKATKTCVTAFRSKRKSLIGILDTLEVKNCGPNNQDQIYAVLAMPDKRHKICRSNSVKFVKSNQCTKWKQVKDQPYNSICVRGESVEGYKGLCMVRESAAYGNEIQLRIEDLFFRRISKDGTPTGDWNSHGGNIVSQQVLSDGAQRFITKGSKRSITRYKDRLDARKVKNANDPNHFWYFKRK